jgi:hydroxymethylbilane synthase
VRRSEPHPVRVGTRRSPLALAQAGLVIRALQRASPSSSFELVPMTTEGDRRRRAQGELDFTSWIDRELERGGIDLAVHSAKDLPAEGTPGLVVGAYPRREDPRDCVVLREGGSTASIPPGARLGCTSLRRRVQLLAWRPDLTIVPVRGNVGTRIARVPALRLGGVVLAVAGLARLGWRDRISMYLPLGRVLPAPGQGALAVELRRGDRSLERLVRRIDHPATRAAITAERAVVAALGGDCNLPLAAYAQCRSGRLRIQAVLFSTDGRHRLSATRAGPSARASALGRTLGRALSRARERIPPGSLEG